MTGRAELFRALGSLCEPPSPVSRDLGTALSLPGEATDHDHTDMFLFQLYPYSSVYLGAEGMLGGEARDRVAGFWRALGLRPPAEPDHLTALLALYAGLIESERDEPDEARRALRRQSRKAFLWEHLLSWVPMYAEKARDVAPAFYAEWADLLVETLANEVTIVGRQEALPLHLRSAPGLPVPSEDAKLFLSGLLTPVRSGMILTRSDLARAARDLDLGLRIGERRFVLESLLSQDGDATLSWLAREASAWAVRHSRYVHWFEGISWFWKRRAETAEGLLSEVRPSAKEEVSHAARHEG